MKKEKSFCSMLGVELKNKEDTIVPVMQSRKVDGIRFNAMKGELFARSLKVIKNKQLHEKFSDIKLLTSYSKMVVDGEFYKHDLTFQEITALVMTEDFMADKTIKKLQKKESTLLKYYGVNPESKMVEFLNPLEMHIFDMFDPDQPLESFESRSQEILKSFVDNEKIKIVKQTWRYSHEAIMKEDRKYLDEGYEGPILRNPEAKYKFGRSTIREFGLVKLKPWETYDAVILDLEERMENLCESETNELGQSFKHNFKDMKKPTGLAGTFKVAFNDGEETHFLKVTITGDVKFRKEIWDKRRSQLGKMIEYRGMSVGAKDVPRHPTFLRFREDRD